MGAGIQILRSLLVYGLCLPLAVILGYYLANPLDMTTFGLVGLVFVLLLTPLLLRAHQPILLFTWNASAIIFFFPGRPSVWLLMVAISFFIAIIHHALNRELKFAQVRSLTFSLIFLGLVIAVTAYITGVGLGVFGSAVMNGKRYLVMLACLLGYFALTSQPIPVERARLFASLYLLGGVTYAIGSLVPLASKSMYWIFLLFPPNDYVSSGFIGESQALVRRLVGMSPAAGALIGYMFARYGIRGIFSVARPWRLLVFLGSVTLGMLGGYRSWLILFALTFAAQFYLEGLMRTRLMPLFVVLGLLAGICAIPLASRLPPPVQRTMAFIPGIKIDSMIRAEAETSSDWRWRMWKAVLPEVPKYFWLGKGFGLKSQDLEMSELDMQFGFEDDFYAHMASGNYHNGPLSVIIPFGIWGAIGFLWFLGAFLHTLYRNYRYGDESLRPINTYLFAAGLAQAISFVAVFGDFSYALASFVGLAGLSVALNNGRRDPATVPVTQPAQAVAISRLVPTPSV